MEYRTLGQTELQVSQVGFGGWAIGGNAYGNSFGNADDITSLAALNTAYDLGCTLFSTADFYGHGHSETLIGKALKGWERDRLIVATKVGQDFSGPALRINFSERYLRSAVEASLKRLQVEALDICYLDHPTLELIQLGRMFEVMSALRQEGKIRHYGITIHDPQEGIQAIAVGQVQVVEAVFNLFDPRAAVALFQTCLETQTGLIIREPLARGFLSGRYTADTTFEKGDVRAVWPKPLIAKRVLAADQFKSILPPGYPGLSNLTLQYALAQPGVSAVVPDCKTPDEVRENFQTPHLPPLSAETLQQIQELQQRIF